MENCLRTWEAPLELAFIRNLRRELVPLLNTGGFAYKNQSLFPILVHAFLSLLLGGGMRLIALSSM